MNDYRVRLQVGDRVLMPSGYALVTEIHRLGCTVRTVVGEEDQVPWIDLTPLDVSNGSARAAHVALRPLLDMLDEETLAEAQDWLEAINTILTGYALAHREFALDGEPFYPYGPTYGVSIDKRCQRMADELSHERSADRRRQRRVRRGELKSTTVSKNTVRNKLNAWETRGFAGLIDGRRIRRTDRFGTIDETFRSEINAIVTGLDGDRSTISHREILRRARVAMHKRGYQNYAAPQRATAEYLSWLMSKRGDTTRAQRSNKLRGSSGHTSFEAIRPGQTVALDVTRADVLVADPLHERCFSVEIISAIDVATRVVLALRVVPKSADGVDAGLILYDILRPFSLQVSGTEVSHWRWAGLPAAVEIAVDEVQTDTHRPTRTPNSREATTGLTLQGVHHIPGLVPGAIRADHGSIFVSEHFRMLLRDFGIDLMLSRGTRPTDNSAIERLHETFQRAYQVLPGYKGRNVAGRGRKVADEPVCTAAELEEHLRRWVALDYHQSWHQGIVIPGAPELRAGPLALFDAMLTVTGRLDIPQSPRLLYQFLPVRWGTIRHDGVEFANLTYDDRCLDAYRAVRAGDFRAKDAAMPFFYDPHDVTRIWWSNPDTGYVHEVPWRKQFLNDAPMTDKIRDHLLAHVKRRGGNLRLNTDAIQRLIIDELTELRTAPSVAPEVRAMLAAGSRRVEASNLDHAEAQAAQDHAQRTSASGNGSDSHKHPMDPSNVGPGDARQPDRQTEASTPDDSEELLDFDEPWPDYSEVT